MGQGSTLRARTDGTSNCSKADLAGLDSAQDIDHHSGDSLIQAYMNLMDLEQMMHLEIREFYDKTPHSIDRRYVS